MNATPYGCTTGMAGASTLFPLPRIPYVPVGKLNRIFGNPIVRGLAVGHP